MDNKYICIFCNDFNGDNICDLTSESIIYCDGNKDKKKCPFWSKK